MSFPRHYFTLNVPNPGHSLLLVLKVKSPVRPGPPHIPDIRIYNLRRALRCLRLIQFNNTIQVGWFVTMVRHETRARTGRPGQGRVQLAKVLIGGNRYGNLFDKFGEVIWKNGVSWDWSEFRRTLIELLLRLHSPPSWCPESLTSIKNTFEECGGTRKSLMWILSRDMVWNIRPGAPSQPDIIRSHHINRDF